MEVSEQAIAGIQTFDVSTQLEGVSSALVTGAQDMGTQAISLVTSIIPVAIGIVAVGVLVNFGLKWVKRATGKG